MSQITEINISPIDEEEAMIISTREKGDYIPLTGEEFKTEKKKYMLMAKSELQKREAKKVVSLRLAQSDINKIKLLAKKEGLPYQTLLGAIIHKVANSDIELMIK